MSNKKYASPLRIEIKPSRMLTTIALFMHVGAAMILLLSVLPWMVKLMLLSIILISLLVYLQMNSHVRTLYFARNLFPQIEHVIWGDDDSWTLVTTGGDEIRADLTQHCFVHPVVTIVSIRLLNTPWYKRYRSLVFLSDNIEAELFRRLRVRLRLLSTPDQDSSLVPK